MICLRELLLPHLRQKLLIAILLPPAIALPWFYLQLHPTGTPITLPSTPIDALIPFHPSWVYPYLSLYILASLPPWLLRSRSCLEGYVVGILFMTLVAHCCFALLPTAVPMRPMADGTWLFSWLHTVDRAAQACPSLHAALAIHAALVLEDALSNARIRLFFWLWSITVVASSLALKQHVVLDSFGGILLAVASYGISRRVSRRRDASFNPISRTIKSSCPEAAI